MSRVLRRLRHWWTGDVRDVRHGGSPWCAFKWWYVRNYCDKEKGWKGCWCDAVSWANGYDGFVRIEESSDASCQQDAKRDGRCYCGHHEADEPIRGEYADEASGGATVSAAKDARGLRVLVACEFSGTVRDAFAARGHHAVSCDLLPSQAPGLHYQGDVRDLLDGWEPVQFMGDCDPDGDGWCQTRDCDPNDCRCLGPTQDGVEYREVGDVLLGRPEEAPGWDLMICFPPCTFLCSSGLHWNMRRPGRAQQTDDALEFVRLLLSAPIPRIALENPVGCISTRVRPYDQQIHPWQFGENASKAPCLWLKGLPALSPTNVLPGGRKARRANQTPSGQNKLGPSATRWAERSKTYHGIADAMADQWGAALTGNDLPLFGAPQ